ncbi:MAG: PadR family transcriptional regulator [Dehalococcoidia bacterium]|nr:PadR family transcriptional regulator [Dehalococcoidia bacterium]
MNFLTTAALLDACVLAALKNEDAYGYLLTQKVSDVIQVSESALYPVLRRLQKGHLLETYDQPFNGRNRRYYRITQSGRKLLEQYRNDWRDCKTKLDFILEGTSDHE